MRRPIQFGKYLLLGRISVGGMAEVFKAKSFGVQGFEKIIAIKRILPSLCGDDDFISMFIDEAKIAGQLAHANIGQIHELGQVDGTHFIAMEYIWGRDLLQLQNRFKKRGRTLSTSAASFIVMKVCEGLQYAHKKRDVLGAPMEIVHRDCSPQNVVISFEGEVKLIDFGIARAASRSSRTNAGVLKGKFGYMSPEQVRGLPLDRRSDIFSLGIILFEALTGKRLFDGESDFSTLEKVRNVEIDEVALSQGDVPDPLQAIVRKALARSPEERYQWCSEMRDDLLMYLQTNEEAYSYRSLGTEMRDIFVDELDRERELMDIYNRIGPEGLPAEDESVERLVSLDDSDIGDSSDESVLDAIDLIETSEPMGRRISSGGVDGFEDNPTEIFGEIEMDEILAAATASTASAGSIVPPPASLPAQAAPPPVEKPPSVEVAVPHSIDVAELFDGRLDRGISQPLSAGEGGGKIVVASQAKSGVPSGSALVASLPTLEGRNPVNDPATPRPTGGMEAVAGPNNSGAYALNSIGSTPSVQMNAMGGHVGAVGATAAIPATGVRTFPSRVRTNRVIYLGVGLVVAAAVIVMGVRGLFFTERNSNASAGPRATLVVLVGDKESADVFLEDKKVGKVPVGDAFSVDALKPGIYNLRVERNGVVGCRSKIEVRASKAKVFSCDFSVNNVGTLVIDQLLPSDIVVIDGKAVARALLKNPLELASDRSHTVAVSRDGRLVEEFEVTVETGKESRRAITPTSANVDAGVESMSIEPDVLKTSLVVEKPRVEKTIVEKKKPVENDDDPKTKPKPEKKDKIESAKAKEVPVEEPVATGPGYLVPWTRPWARVYIDGKDTGKVTPVAPSAKIKLSPGAHKVTFVVGSKKHVFTVNIKSGEITKLSKILDP